MKPLLDIITVTKDDPDGVAATIASTRKLRTYSGIRQIIVDSSDETAASKVRSMLAEEENLDYFWQEPIGIASAFNLGIDHSTAQWLWFLNGRDEVYPGLDVNMLLQLLGASQAEVMIFQIEYMGAKLERAKHPPLWALWPPLYPNWVPHPATFIRLSLFERYGVFDTYYKIAMDGDLWIRLFSKDVTVDMLSFPVALYDLNGISATNHSARDKEARGIFRRNIGIFTRKWLSTGWHLFISFIGLEFITITKVRNLTMRILKKIWRIVSNKLHPLIFANSAQYWDDRYKTGGNSGAGSYGRLAQFKANVLNDFVTKHEIHSVVEYGCGDGAQLELAIYPEYTGFDVSPRAVAICRKKFSGLSNYQFMETKIHLEIEGGFDLAISLDVIYHLIEDDVFDAYMKRLFASSKNFVIIYSNNIDMKFDGAHVRGRKFTSWCDAYAKDWMLFQTIENQYPYDPAVPDDTSHSDFYIFKRAG
jgi:glycosyltransferase involved in cell wall biosynthesis